MLSGGLHEEEGKNRQSTFQHLESTKSTVSSHDLRPWGSKTCLPLVGGDTVVCDCLLCYYMERLYIPD